MLLTSVGETRRLAATVLQPDGAGAAPQWQSSDEGIASVAQDGTVTARALGSAQVTAVSGDLRSAPVLVVVAEIGEGVVAVPDDQILSDPVDTDPAGEPDASATYDVIVAGTAPAVGARLIGTGERALAGEVVATAPAAGGTKLTMRLVPLGDLLPGLELEETMDLSEAPITVPAEVASEYDVSRSGNRFTFTPKAGAAAAGSFGSDMVPIAWREPAGAGAVAAAEGPGPFDECEGSLPSLPLGLKSPAQVEVEIDPTLQVAWSGGRLQRLVVRSEPTFTVKVALTVEAAFEATYECKAELLTLFFPITGPLSLFIAGVIPIGVGFEVGGSFTLASMEVGGEAEASWTSTIGIDCSAGSCETVGGLEGLETAFKPVVDAPAISDVRFEPSLEVFGWVEADVGNRFLRRLRFQAVEAKVGAKLGADWAPRLVQILDTEYASKYGLTLEASAKAGPRLGELAEMLGLDDLGFLEAESSLPLVGSPTGTMQADKARYETGDTVTVHVTLAEAGLNLLGLLYNVDHVILVRHSGGREEIVASSPEASDGQREFDLSFQAPGPVEAGELHAFVVTEIPALDFFALELARGDQPQGTPKPTAPAAEGGWHGTLALQGANPIEFDVDLVAEVRPAQTTSFGEIAFDRFTLGGIPFVDATGTIQVDILRGGSLRVLLDIRNGAQMAPCVLHFEGRGTMGDAANRIEVPVEGRSPCGAGNGTLVLEQR